MLKKIFVTLLFCAAILAGSQICGAVLPPSQMFLGGLTVGQRGYPSQVQKIYGSPTRKIEDTHSRRNINVYGNSSYLEWEEDSVIKIIVTKNNGWATPAGLTVGMDADVAKKLYGEPDNTWLTGDVAHSWSGYIYDGEVFFQENYKLPAQFFIGFDTHEKKIKSIMLVATKGLLGHGTNENFWDFVEDTWAFVK